VTGAMEIDPVRDNRTEQRFELAAEGGVAVAYYMRTPDTITFTHTEVPPAMKGGGVGSRLIKAALDRVRAEGLKAVPQCPFVAAYIRKHPEYADLVIGQ
jgi:predicted GNAT family acetyltransferase